MERSTVPIDRRNYCMNFKYHNIQVVPAHMSIEIHTSFLHLQMKVSDAGIEKMDKWIND